ncbi:ABC transporter substrate-binding protein [Chromobacterium sp. IIBBL 290-4]|uniref:substrate-binding periplasmic protein n=1 Tax=Chromobacterium sp. IIBBL 290-4 TaxID=2953890 RepID=UPI0020B8A9BE|nr:transporter substrate-binding domain-containing protein [Chromobacterium sp. IIBBL 290-4]UTH74911.1 transporter substrate-binding domain-containing protein [Chromobacterium sp. IIBBL 290-4]
MSQHVLCSARRLMLGLICLFAALPALCAPVLRVAFSSQRPPFSFYDDKQGDTGIEVDIMRAALNKMGYELKPIIVPNSRLILEVAKGKADIASAVHEHGADRPGLYLSDGMVEYDNIVIAKKKRRLSIRSLTDLMQHDFVIWQHGWQDLGEPFRAAFQPDRNGRFRANYHETANQESQCKMFWANRTELIVIDRTVFSWYRKKLEASMPTGEDLSFFPLFPQATQYPAAFRSMALRDRFNQELKALRKSGEYQRIVSRYRLAG